MSELTVTATVSEAWVIVANMTTTSSPSAKSRKLAEIARVKD